MANVITTINNFDWDVCLVVKFIRSTPGLTSNRRMKYKSASIPVLDFIGFSCLNLLYYCILFKYLSGREFFVGISETSNEAGASAVAEAFPEFPCTPIKVPIVSLL